jgi:hypothetical protein
MPGCLAQSDCSRPLAPHPGSSYAPGKTGTRRVETTRESWSSQFLTPGKAVDWTVSGIRDLRGCWSRRDTIPRRRVIDTMRLPISWIASTVRWPAYDYAVLVDDRLLIRPTHAHDGTQLADSRLKIRQACNTLIPPFLQNPGCPAVLRAATCEPSPSQKRTASRQWLPAAKPPKALANARIQ